eukprot:3682623-Prymnesium_polylepis.1
MCFRFLIRASVLVRTAAQNKGAAAAKLAAEKNKAEGKVAGQVGEVTDKFMAATQAEREQIWNAMLQSSSVKSRALLFDRLWKLTTDDKKPETLRQLLSGLPVEHRTAFSNELVEKLPVEERNATTERLLRQLSAHEMDDFCDFLPWIWGDLTVSRSWRKSLAAAHAPTGSNDSA